MRRVSRSKNRDDDEENSPKEAKENENRNQSLSPCLPVTQFGLRVSQKVLFEVVPSLQSPQCGPL